MHPSRIAFLDFEASSLGAGSFPIEVGWVTESGLGESYLIRPEPAWTDWSAESERIHGISRDHLLAKGIDAARAAQQVAVGLAGRVVVSDNPTFEHYWLTRLLATVGLTAPPVEHIRVLLEAQMWRIEDDDQGRTARNIVINAYEGARLTQTTSHRALADALDMWKCWHAVRTAVDQRVVATPGDGK